MTVEVTPRATPVARVEQRVYHVGAREKVTLLTGILEDPALSRVLVFSRTKHRANKITEKLGRAGVSVEVIHGNKSQSSRQRLTVAGDGVTPALPNKAEMAGKRSRRPRRNGGARNQRRDRAAAPNAGAMRFPRDLPASA